MSVMVPRFGRAASMAALFVSLGASAALFPACSSNNNSTACDESKCKTNNHCITTATQGATAGNTQCRFPCAHSADCPLSYHCDANAGGSEPYCVADKYTTQNNGLGVWGHPCFPNKTNKADLTNEACDASQGFRCYATSPTDGSAFCTIYGCAADDDCGAGFYCATTNTLPNAVTVNRAKDKETLTVCLPRDYCAPCTSDIDCGPSAAGVAQHCTADSTGAASFCAPECTDDTNCRADAKCNDYGGYKACAPRAGVCAGNGDICSPCRSDADCPNGFCFQADYSEEKFCTVKSAVKCTEDASGNLVAKCPAAPSPGTKVGCTEAANAPTLPADQCIGVVLKGTGADQGYVVGCWTKHE